MDLREGVRKQLEDVVEARPALRESLGLVFQTMIPLDVSIKDIQSVKVDEAGRVKMAVPLRKDIVIPLGIQDARKLVVELEKLMKVQRAKRALKALRKMKVWKK